MHVLHGDLTDAAMAVQVGPQGVGLKVKEPKKYNFDPKHLLLQICEVTRYSSPRLPTQLKMSQPLLNNVVAAAAAAA